MVIIVEFDKQSETIMKWNGIMFLVYAQRLHHRVKKKAHHFCLVLDILVALVQPDLILYYLILYFCDNLYIPQCRFLDLCGVFFLFLLQERITSNLIKVCRLSCSICFCYHKQHSSYHFH